MNDNDHTHLGEDTSIDISQLWMGETPEPPKVEMEVTPLVSKSITLPDGSQFTTRVLQDSLETNPLPSFSTEE